MLWGDKVVGGWEKRPQGKVLTWELGVARGPKLVSWSCCFYLIRVKNVWSLPTGVDKIVLVCLVWIWTTQGRETIWNDETGVVKGAKRVGCVKQQLAPWQRWFNHFKRIKSSFRHSNMICGAMIRTLSTNELRWGWVQFATAGKRKGAGQKELEKPNRLFLQVSTNIYNLTYNLLLSIYRRLYPDLAGWNRHLTKLPLLHHLGVKEQASWGEKLTIYHTSCDFIITIYRYGQNQTWYRPKESKNRIKSQ